jgi:hypothetical protein
MPRIRGRASAAAPHCVGEWKTRFNVPVVIVSAAMRQAPRTNDTPVSRAKAGLREGVRRGAVDKQESQHKRSPCAVSYGGAAYAIAFIRAICLGGRIVFRKNQVAV